VASILLFEWVSQVEKGAGRAASDGRPVADEFPFAAGEAAGRVAAHAGPPAGG